MKTIILVFSIILTNYISKAQSISPSGITTLAGYYSTATITVTFSEGVIIPEFVMTPTSSIKNDNLDLKSTLIYPNPSKESFTVEFNSTAINAQIEIYNIMGKLVSSENINSIKQTFSCEKFGPGIYFVHIIEGESLYTEKLVVQ